MVSARGVRPRAGGVYCVGSVGFCEEAHNRDQQGFQAAGDSAKSILYDITSLTSCIMKTSRRKHPWTIVHSFYAGMGGFAFETDDSGLLPYIRNSPRVVLTAVGVLELAKLGYIPDISEESIQDKSKADSFSKGFAILQASWFIIQCISRLAACLPLTPLEVSTLAHVAFAMFTYTLWWKKPLEIQDPMIISGKWVRPMCASMWMFSSSAHTHRGDIHAYKTFEPEVENLIFFQDEAAKKSTLSELPIMTQGFDDTSVELQPNDDSVPQVEIIDLYSGSRSELKIPVNSKIEKNYKSVIKAGQILSDCAIGPKSSSVRFATQNAGTTENPDWWTPKKHIPLDLITITRWRLATAALHHYPTIWMKYRQAYPQSYSHTLVDWAGGRYCYEYARSSLTQDYVSLSISNAPNSGLLQRPSSILPSIALSLATAIYGGIHVIAWNLHFPTAKQALYWKLSAADIAASGMLYSIGYWLVATHKHRLDPLSRMKSRKAEFALFILILVPTLLGLLLVAAYIVARGYLPVEALISLKALPVEAYETPKWSQYLPHL
jgi:hypothetical protein